MMPPETPIAPTNDEPVPPKVDGQIGNALVGGGYALGKLSRAIRGDEGLRMLALAFVASVTWVATWKIKQDAETETTMRSLLVRTGEDRVEREKAESSRREKESRDWMTSEGEKNRRNFADNVAYLVKAFETESERNRAMVFKLATERRPNPGEIP